jgi:hypothetical protein
VLTLLAAMRAGEYLYIQVSQCEFVLPYLLCLLRYNVNALQCADGNGRTGTIAALLLGLAQNLSSSEALDLTQRCKGCLFEEGLAIIFTN